MPQANVEELWSRITCPTLLIYGKESWASNPAEDGRLRHFANGLAQVVSFERAGHWVHHDRLEAFMATVQPFLAGHPVPQIS
jgi:pimeloyl-ACP methyl ester carboxylesterase